MKSTRHLRVTLFVLLLFGSILMAATPSYAWRGWWGWPAGVGVGLAVTAPCWAGYSCYAPPAGYYRAYGYPDPYYSGPYYSDPYYSDSYYPERGYPARVYYYPY